MGAEIFDLASTSSAGAATGALRQLNQRLHDLTEETAKTPWRILHPRAHTRWPPESMRPWKSISKATLVTIALA